MMILLSMKKNFFRSDSMQKDAKLIQIDEIKVEKK